MAERQMTQPGGRRVDEFTVAMSLDRCVRRLENKHEPGTFWAWDWQYRTWVKLRQQDALTVRFTMRRVERSRFELPWSYASVRGVLRALDDDRTVVIAKAHIAGVWVFVLSLFFGVSFGFALAPLHGLSAFDSRTTVLFVLLVTALTAGFLVLTWFWIQHQLRVLFGELHEALTHWG